jgi:hypothetical protein
MKIKGEMKTCGDLDRCSHIRWHEHEQAPVRGGRLLESGNSGGLEEEENEEFKYRVYRNIQRTQGSKLGEWIMGDIGTAGVTIH